MSVNHCSAASGSSLPVKAFGFNFMKLNPKAFTGNEEPLAAEQWLTDMTNFQEAANIPAADQVKVVKIQLKDIARAW